MGVDATVVVRAAAVEDGEGVEVCGVGDCTGYGPPARGSVRAETGWRAFLGPLEFGGLDVLVSNAGFASPAKLCDLSPEEWTRMFDINLRGARVLAKSCYPHLKESRGAACFTASMSEIPQSKVTNSWTPSFTNCSTASVFRPKPSSCLCGM